MSRVVAQKVAEQAAPVLTDAMISTFNQSTDAYGVGWVPGEDGQKITLRKSGALAKQLRYVAIGTRLRVALGVKYAKYQIGRRPVLPRQSAGLPAPYVQLLKETIVRVCKEELGQ
jgi:hypothetical protein